MKKFLAIMLVLAMALMMLAGCQSQPVATESPAAEETAAPEESAAAEETAAPEESATAVPADFKVGFIFLHDENSTYDKNFMDAAKAVQQELGLTDDQVMFKTNIPESNECYEAAAERADAGCKLIFADSFGHEDYMIQAAREYPEVQF